MMFILQMSIHEEDLSDLKVENTPKISYFMK